MKLLKIVHVHNEVELNRRSPFDSSPILITLITSLSLLVVRLCRSSWLSIVASVAVFPLLTPQPALGQPCSNTPVTNNVQCISSATNTDTGPVSVTFPIGYAAGTTIIAQGATNGPQTFTAGMLTNTAGYAWTFWGLCAIPGASQSEAFWYYKTTVANGSTDTITLNNGTGDRQWLNVVLYSGLGPIDGAGLCGSTNGTLNVSGNYIVHNGDINVGLGINSILETVGTGWTSREQDMTCPCTMIEDQVQGSSPATLYQTNLEDVSNTASPPFSQPTQHFDMLLIGGGTDPSGSAGVFTSAPTITGENDTMAEISTFTTSDGRGNQKLWANYNMEGGHTPTMTCNTTGSSGGGPNPNFAGCFVLELTGVNTLDQIASSGVVNFVPMPLTSPTITTTRDNEIIVCIASNTHYPGGGFMSAGPGFTPVAFFSQGIEYKTVSSKGTYSCTMNVNIVASDFVITIASFYQSGTITANAQFGFGGEGATIGVAFMQAVTSEKEKEKEDENENEKEKEKEKEKEGNPFEHVDRISHSVHGKRW